MGLGESEMNEESIVISRLGMLRKMMLFCCYSFLLMSLTGCATYRPRSTVHFQRLLDTWKTKDINNLVYTWGPPTSTFTMPNGNKMFTWAHIKLGAPSAESPVVPGLSGSPSAAFGQIRSASTTPVWDCAITAITDSSNTIISWQLKGSDCAISYSDEELKQRAKSLRERCSTLKVGTPIRLIIFEGASANNGYKYASTYEGYFAGFDDRTDEVSIRTTSSAILNITENYRSNVIEDLEILPSDALKRPK
jgi:hypothetical protein